MSHEETRKYRINYLLRAIKKCTDEERPTIEEKLKSYFSYQWGACEKSMNDYLNVLINSGLVERRENGLWAIKQKEETEAENFFKNIKDAK